MKMIIADPDRDFCQLLCAKLTMHLPAAEVSWVNDGLVLLQRIREHMPDLVVVNLLLPGKDGLACMNAIRTMPLQKQPAFLVLAGYMTPAIHRELCQMQVSYFTAVPCDINVLAQHIQSCCREQVYRAAISADKPAAQLTALLRDLGLTMHCKGFRYARFGLEYMMEKGGGDLLVTKELYPVIAAQFGTTSANVERAIRTAIFTAWQKSGYLLQQDLFRQRPTNSEFFAVLSEKLRLERLCAADNG